jgi:hypothetical protein
MWGASVPSSPAREGRPVIRVTQAEVGSHLHLGPQAAFGDLNQEGRKEGRGPHQDALVFS